MIPNLQFVDVGVWRSGRPPAEDYHLVKEDFQKVLSLEGIEEDEKESQGLDPLEVLQFPISFFEIYALGVSSNKLSNILTAIDKAPKPLLVHCQHGEDRTGLVIACYRVRRGWDKPTAWAEARQYGYRWWLNSGLNKTWKEFPVG